MGTRFFYKDFNPQLRILMQILQILAINRTMNVGEPTEDEQGYM